MEVDEVKEEVKGENKEEGKGEEGKGEVVEVKDYKITVISTDCVKETICKYIN